MESTAVLIEGSEWGSFNGVSVNEEADFMAKMFPNSSMSHHELELSSSLSLLSSVYSGYESKNDVIMDESGSFNSNDGNSNCFSLSQESSLSERSDGAGYQCNEIYFVMSDADQFLAVDGTALPVGFCLDSKGCIQEYPTERNHVLNVEMSCDNDNSDGCVTELIKPNSSDLNLKLDMADNEPAYDDDKSGDLSEHGKKRCRKSEVKKGKRNVRSKKSQSSSSCISREELSGETSNAKTRCPRGSAIDPQSLYARKRRERINERLRILQNLIPNGTKVDISTMLEEAVQYVKFLELQIKLLSSDDLWMFAPLAYNGLDIGLDSKLNSLLHSQT